MGRATVEVDVRAIRLRKQHVDVGAEAAEQVRRHHAGRAVGAVDRQAQAAQRVARGLAQVLDVGLGRVRLAADDPELGVGAAGQSLCLEDEALQRCLGLVIHLASP